MRGFFSPARFRRPFAWRLLLAVCLLLPAASRVAAQSTFGAILGTVRDSSGALILKARR